MKVFLKLFFILLFPVTAFCSSSHSYSNSPVCAGQTLNLYDTGLVYSATATYYWYGPGGFTSTLEYPTIVGVTSAAAGTYYCVRNGSDTTSTVVVVNYAPPVPITDTLFPLCSGGNLNLRAYDTVGSTFVWTGPNGFSSTDAETTISGVATNATGLYTVTVSLYGCTSTRTVYALVDSTPATPSVSCSTAPPYCSGETLYFTSSSATSGVAYSWSGPDGFTSTLQSPPLYDAQTLNSGNYSVTVTKGICSSTSFTGITVGQTPTVPVCTSTAPVCAGGLLTLGANATPGTGTYYWSGPNSFSSSLQYPSILNVQVAATGVYSVYETVNGCVSPVGSIYVLINPTPTVPVAWSNSPICQGATLMLSATDDSSGVSWSWAGPGGFISVDEYPTLGGAPTSAAGIYTVTATIGTCTQSQVISVGVIAAPLLIATSNSPVCTGDTLKLQATSGAGNTFVWTGPFSFTGAGGAPTRFPTQSEDAGVYIVTVTDDNGCTTVGFDTVVVNNTPAPPWVTWLTYCQKAYAPPLMANDATNVLWFATDAGAGGVATAPTPSTTTPGVYFFYLNQTQNGCPSAIDSIQVIVNPRPVVTLSPASVSMCPHDSVQYATVDADVNDTYRWFPSLYLSDSLSANPLSKPVASTNYMMITTNEYSCSDTEYANIVVYAAGVIEIQAGDSVTVYSGEPYHLQPYTNCTSFSWFPPVGLDNPSVSDPTITPDANTIYTVRGTTENGCVAVDSIAFHVNQETLYGVPNAFTPGNGVNNLFKLYELGKAQLNHFRIFNRWGEQVFETSDISQGWDGTFNGTPQPQGVYVYQIQAVSGITGKITNLNGNLTLIR